MIKMKQLTILTLISIMFFTLQSCTTDSIQKTYPKQNVVLKFKSSSNITTSSEGNNNNEDSITKIEVSIEYINGKPKLISNKILEIDAKLENNKETYGYILKKKEYSSNNYTTMATGMDANYEWSIEDGYGFDGECFVYGTFYHGNNGQTIFVPC